MNPHKKNIELTGSLIYPIEVGEAAFIREADGSYRLSITVRPIASILTPTVGRSRKSIGRF